MKVAIYCRLSNEDRHKLLQKNDSESICNQKVMLSRYAEDNGWTIFDIYSDDDYSGADRDRPEFNRMIEDAMEKKFDIILCKTQSRFTRELELVEKYINGLFPSIGIRFISVVDSTDTDDKSNKKTRQLTGLVNEWFLEDLSDHIRSVLTSRRKQGYHIGPFAPYGYRKDPNVKGHLIIDPEAAEIVRRIYMLYLEGNGKRKIARILNDTGIPNPSEYKRLHEIIRNNKKNYSPLWSYSTVTNILTNEVYIGNMIQGKAGIGSLKTQEKITYPQERWIIVHGTHEPIIDQDTWHKVQMMIAEKTTTGQKQQEGAFARKVRCMYCGFRMGTVKYGKQRGYKCARHARSHDACIGTYISLPKLEHIVETEIRTMTRELLDDETLSKEMDSSPELGHMKSCDSANHNYVDARTLSKEMVSILIDHILVGKRDPVTKKNLVEIHWNF